MGHANLENVSRFFVNRLYAVGRLSVSECVKGLIAAGETVHASEGEYEDEGMLGYAVEQVLDHLHCCDDPVVEPVWMPRLKPIPRGVKTLLKSFEADPDDDQVSGVVADGLLDEGLEDAAKFVRETPARRRAYLSWANNDDEFHDSDYDDPNSLGRLFDEVEWVFSPGWRTRYKEVELLGNVTN